MKTITIPKSDCEFENLPDSIELSSQEFAVVAPLLRAMLNSRPPAAEGPNPNLVCDTIPGYGGSTEYIITAEPNGEFYVWDRYCKFFHIPMADFRTKEEADEYIRSCQKDDQLKREFQAWFERRTQELELPERAATNVIYYSLPHFE